MFREEATNTNFIVIWIDLTGARTPNQPHLRRARFEGQTLQWPTEKGQKDKQ
jgi:hypothetical protein